MGVMYMFVYVSVCLYYIICNMLTSIVYCED